VTADPVHTSPSDPAPEWRLAHTLAVIDAINSVDPNWVQVRGRERPKELGHAELASEWVLKLAPQASEVLQLAVRAHHLERWRVPRDSFPVGRLGYLRWRKHLQQYHAERAGILLAGERYPEALILRVQELIRKHGLGTDPEVQVLEDAVCLVFLETQFGELCARTPASKMVDITGRTLEKMSAQARRLALTLSFDATARAVLERAIAATSRDAQTGSGVFPEPGSTGTSAQPPPPWAPSSTTR
jgi:hypothetical protein